MLELSSTVPLRIVRGDPSADELAALVAVLAMTQHDSVAQDAPAARGDVASDVLRRTGRALPGRSPGRAPTLSRPRWHDAVRPVAAIDRSSSRRRQAS